jgi:hypothetical protein
MDFLFFSVVLQGGQINEIDASPCVIDESIVDTQYYRIT